MILPKIHINVERYKKHPTLNVYVSNMGHVRNADKSLKPLKINSQGYMMANIGKKSYFVHRLVLETWRPVNDSSNLTVDHLNHNKRENTVKNLEWVTREENLRRAKEDFNAKKAQNVFGEESSKQENISANFKAIKTAFNSGKFLMKDTSSKVLYSYDGLKNFLATHQGNSCSIDTCIKKAISGNKYCGKQFVLVEV